MDTEAAVSLPTLRDTFFERAPLPMLLLDDEQRCLDANQALVSWLGYDRGDLLRRSRQEAAACVSFNTNSSWDELLRRGGMIGRCAVVGHNGDRLAVEYSATANVSPGRHLVVLLVAPEPLNPDPPLIKDGLAAASDWDGSKITDRERDVLWLIADGATNAQIALALGIAETTTQAHVDAVKRKLETTTRAQTVAQALRQGALHQEAVDERLYIMQAIRDDQRQICDMRLLYISRETSLSQRQIVRYLGAAMSSWYPDWHDSGIYSLARRALEQKSPEEDEQLAVFPPWAPEGYLVHAVAIPLARDRVALRARPLRQPVSVGDNGLSRRDGQRII